MKGKFRYLVGLIAVFALLAAACGDDGATASDEVVVTITKGTKVSGN